MLIILGLGEICLRLIFVKYPRPLTLDEKLGWKTTPNYYRRVVLKDAGGQEYQAEVTTDKNGFKLFGNPAAERTKIFVIGDSFTQALEVSNEKAYYGILADRLKQVEIFAYGAAGYSSLQEMMMIDEVVDTIRPQVILLQFCFNDFFDNDARIDLVGDNNAVTRPYMDLQGNIFYKNPANCPEIISRLIPYSSLIKFSVGKITRLLAARREADAIIKEIEKEGNTHEKFQHAAAVTQKIIEAIGKRTSGITMLTFSADEKEPYFSEFKKIASLEGFRFIEGIPEALRDYERRGFTTKAADHYHWNELGHKIVAEKIYEYLVNLKSGLPIR